MNFIKEKRSYQLHDVSILIMCILTFIMLKKVYGNENCSFVFRIIITRKTVERKPFEETYCFIGQIRYVVQDMLKTLFKIICVAPRFWFVKSTHFADIKSLLPASASKFSMIV